MVGDQVLIDLGHVPTRQERVDAVHEGGVVPHFWRHRPKEVADALLVLYIDVEIAYHHDAAIGANALFASTELTGLHVALRDVHAIVLVEGDARHLIKADHVVLANQALRPLAVFSRTSWQR